MSAVQVVCTKMLHLSLESHEKPGRLNLPRLPAALRTAWISPIWVNSHVRVFDAVDVYPEKFLSCPFNSHFPVVFITVILERLHQIINSGLSLGIPDTVVNIELHYAVLLNNMHGSAVHVENPRSIQPPFSFSYHSRGDTVLPYSDFFSLSTGSDPPLHHPKFLGISREIFSAWTNALLKSVDCVFRSNKMVNINMSRILDHWITNEQVFIFPSLIWASTSPLTHHRNLNFQNEQSGHHLHLKAHVPGTMTFQFCFCQFWFLGTYRQNKNKNKTEADFLEGVWL